MKMSITSTSISTRFLITIVSLLYLRIVFGHVIKITTPQELVNLSNNVSSGTSYSGTTVLLGSDIDFAPLPVQFEPIGNATYPFNGTFDGQGHIIKSLNISSPSQHVGFFGYIINATIRNVVLDEFCSIMRTYSNSKSSPDVGSICGNCSSSTIENIVNMGSVTLTGKGASTFFIGGIASRIIYSTTIRNCVNYGLITYNGFSGTITHFGGIAGSCGGDSFNSIQNCANYGTLIYNGTTRDIYIGGIAGSSITGSNNIENCVSGGIIINITQLSKNNYVGSVLGNANTIATTTITHCTWTSDTEYDNAYGDESSSSTIVNVTDSNLTTLSITTMGELNRFIEQNYNTFSKWLMLHLNGGTLNNLTQDTLLVTQRHFPNPVMERSTFLFWCVDNFAECTKKYEPNSTDISNITGLYAQWSKSTIRFILGNDESDVVYSLNYKDTINYPDDPVREGYSFNGWSDNITIMPAHNINITAQWVSECVEIVFVKKNMKEDEIKAIISEYANNDHFVIEKIFTDKDTGETKVIVRFAGNESARNFIETINASSEINNNWISRVDFISEQVDSYSFIATPSSTLFNNFLF